MASTRLSRTPSSTGNRQIFTQSFWCKIADPSGTQTLAGIFDDSSNYNYCYLDSGALNLQWKASGSLTAQLNTNRLFRDVGAFYHIVYSVDTTQATSSNRIKLYINGVQETSFSTATYPSQNRYTEVNANNITHHIGSVDGSSQYFDGLMTYVAHVDGTAYDASYFGETDSTSGIWKPKTAPSVTWGTNGFLLKFENSGAMGTDSSGNSNTFTVNGTLTQNVDTPSNNFATFNPLAPSGAAQNMQNGNLYLPGPNSNNYWQSVPATMGCTSGKWYWEFKDETDWGSTSDSTRRYGICDLNTIVNTLSSGADVRFSDTTSAYAYMNASGVRYNGSTISGTTSTHPTFQEGDFLMFAMDLDNNKLYFGKNGTWNNSGDPTSGSTGTGSVADISSTATWSPYAEIKYGSDTVSANFGQGYFRTTSAGSNADANGHGKFKYSVPSGYYSINTKNIKEFG